MGYWQTVPKGIWRIEDPTDALNALQDHDSFPEFDSINFRIHVLGPSHKAVILELTTIFAAVEENLELRKQLLDSIQKLLKIQLN